MPDQRIDVSPGEKFPSLERMGNVVPVDYAYSEKLVTPGEDLNLPNAYLKWYNMYSPNVEISLEQVEESRAFITAEIERLKIEGELGFVLLHRAGPVLLLLLTTWREINEMWESVYVKEVNVPTGEYRPMAYENSHRGTYCVWELGVVWHERQAWRRFLSSKRDEQAKLAYVNDRFSGRV